jgi:hypothetical protein
MDFADWFRNFINWYRDNKDWLEPLTWLSSFAGGLGVLLRRPLGRLWLRIRQRASWKSTHNFIRNNRGFVLATSITLLYVFGVIFASPRPDIEPILARITAEPGSIEKAGPHANWWKAGPSEGHEPGTSHSYDPSKSGPGCYGVAWNVDKRVVEVFRGEHKLKFDAGGYYAQVCINSLKLTSRQVGAVQARWLQVNEPQQDRSWKVDDLDNVSD